MGTPETSGASTASWSLRRGIRVSTCQSQVRLTRSVVWLRIIDESDARISHSPVDVVPGC